jgi:DNA-binding MarR family transcriptional regulator
MPQLGRSSRTAATGDVATSSVVAAARIERACRLTIAGKLALRDIAGWTAHAGVNETEFRLLWLLIQKSQSQNADRRACDQAELAHELAVSPAQVSGVIERLRQRELVERVLGVGDRRRQLWRLAPSGEQLVRAVVASVATTETRPLASSRNGGVCQEDAA